MRKKAKNLSAALHESILGCMNDALARKSKPSRRELSDLCDEIAENLVSYFDSIEPEDGGEGWVCLQDAGGEWRWYDPANDEWDGPCLS